MFFVKEKIHFLQNHSSKLHASQNIITHGPKLKLVFLFDI